MTSRVLAGTSSVIGFAIAVAYLAIIQHQDERIDAETWAWAACFAVPAACTLVGAIAADIRLWRVALIGSGFVFFGFGVIAILSIGILFLLAGLLALLGAALLPTRPRAVVR
jgi:surface polysaccharide O-acyltransferase-like enzyme